MFVTVADPPLQHATRLTHANPFTLASTIFIGFLFRFTLNGAAIRSHGHRRGVTLDDMRARNSLRRVAC